MPSENTAEPVIYIVDDDEAVLRALSRLVQSVGMQAETFASPEDLLRHGYGGEPGCLLLDIQLPGIDGIEAFEQLRADATTHDIPVVAVTASAMQEEVSRITSVGFAGYHPKPIRVMEFLQVVQDILASGAPKASES